jgi:glucose-induced degradation protein 8
MRRTYLVVNLIHCLWRIPKNLLCRDGTFRGKIADLHFVDSDINALILDYLTTEGYPSAAAKFSKEANLRPQDEEESVKARREIQQSIHSGNIEEAISALNELEPQVSGT